MKSGKARKQRKDLYTASWHKRRKRMSAHLSEKYLGDEKKAYPRAVPIRKGDTVRITRGADKGHEGKVATTDTKSMTITIEGLTRKKADGTQIGKKIHPSNLTITKLDLSDPMRREKFEALGDRE
ncbi:MAG: 50S ribosomal protein L24 [Thermoplasmata archaeon]|nr:50S ribosomal protein L24 [Thermoplasmata archaeon]